MKLERLALEMDHIEGELKEIERGNLGNTEGEDVDQSDHIGEVHYLRTEMEKILGSDAFQSEEGKSRIQNIYVYLYQYPQRASYKLSIGKSVSNTIPNFH